MLTRTFELGESLLYKKEPENPVDKNAIAIVRTDSIGKETVVGHLPENTVKFCFLFLKVPYTSIEKLNLLEIR